MIDFLGEFTAVVTGLEESGVDYAVCGGWAMALLGAPRATDDIDLLVAAPDLDAAKGVARRLGYVLEAQPVSFREGAIEIRLVSKPAPGWSDDRLTLDLLLVTPEIEGVWRDRLKVSAPFGDFWVVSREGLLRLEELSGRAQDLADIERLGEIGAGGESGPES